MGAQRVAADDAVPFGTSWGTSWTSVSFGLTLPRFFFFLLGWVGKEGMGGGVGQRGKRMCSLELLQCLKKATRKRKTTPGNVPAKQSFHRFFFFSDSFKIKRFSLIGEFVFECL